MNYFDARLAIENGLYTVKTPDISVVLGEEKQERLKALNVPEQDVILGVRPDNMTVSETGIPGKVDVSELMGSSYHLHLTVGGKDVIAIVPTNGRTTAYAGREIRLTFDGNVCHVFSKETEKNLEF